MLIPFFAASVCSSLTHDLANFTRACEIAKETLQRVGATRPGTPLFSASRVINAALAAYETRVSQPVALTEEEAQRLMDQLCAACELAFEDMGAAGARNAFNSPLRSAWEATGSVVWSVRSASHNGTPLQRASA